MGTTFEIFIAGQAEDYAGQAAEAVFAEIDRLEGILSRFDPRSDVGQLSRLQPGQSLRVGIEVIECLTVAAEVYDRTNGTFDVTIAPLLKPPELAGMMPPEKETPGCIGFNRFYFAENGALFFDARRSSQTDPEKEQKLTGTPLTITIIGNPDFTYGGSGSLNLDFGGLGKGYALDKSRDVLSDWGIDRALIHAGTSTALAIGNGPKNPPGKKGWPVGTAGDTIFLYNLAISGSGKEVKGEHIIDPHTGKPAQGHQSAWAVCPSAALGDALSTAFMVMGSGEVEQFCRNNPQVGAKVMSPSGAVKVYNPPFLT
jgi:thiamine biosynthesis lipoprotein